VKAYESLSIAYKSLRNVFEAKHLAVSVPLSAALLSNVRSSSHIILSLEREVNTVVTSGYILNAFCRSKSRPPADVALPFPGYRLRRA